MRPINAHDLEELLQDEGYGVDQDTGEVYDNINQRCVCPANIPRLDVANRRCIANVV